MCNRNKLDDILRKIAQQAQAVFGNRLEQVILYGSYARGDASEASDIDIRIDKGSIRGLQFAGLLGDLEDNLGKKIDLISTNGMDDDFRKAIASEEILLYERQ